MKKKLIIGAVAAIVLLTMGLCLSIGHSKKLGERYGRAVENLEAMDDQYNGMELSNRALSLKVGQLEYFKDSIMHKMDSIRKELGIKDKEIQSLQYLASVARRTDTITVRDTIFRDRHFQLDTLYGDQWYRMRLHLEYPNVIAAEPEFTSQKYILVSNSKEPIGKPRKCFMARWFQRKRTVVRVDVKEGNPYIRDTMNRYVKIID